MNRVCLVGRLARDPETEYVNTSDGSVARTRFTIAVNRSFSSNNDGKQTADFISCVCWRKTAENLAKFQKKGNQISVEGRIQVNSYDDKDGNRVWNTTVLADTIQFLDRKGETTDDNFNDDVKPSDFSSSSNEAGSTVWDAGSNIEIDPDELPFY